MANIQDFIKNSPYVKKIEVDNLLFVEFKCPMEEERSHIWCDNNFFAHALSGSTVLKTPTQTYTLKPGDSVFAKKGGIISQDTAEHDFCELIIFVPDDFIKSVISKYKVNLSRSEPRQYVDTVIPLNSSSLLETYFQSLLPLFHEVHPPPTTLMKLKFEELILTLLSNDSHHALSCYFHQICSWAKPSIVEIMEANFFSNLTLTDFARLCGRSLSAFKVEFNALYHETPGRWLLEKRLDYSRFLLETTDKNIGDIYFECGFENLSHFIRAFKNRYNVTPGKFKLLMDRSAQPH